MDRIDGRSDSRTIPPEYRETRLHVRPARLAVLVPEIPDWGMYCARKSIEILSRTWGGAANIMVPLTSAGEIPDPFWRILHAFDADFYAVYTPTFREYSVAAPDSFNAWCRKEIETSASDAFPAADLASHLKSDEFLSTCIQDRLVSDGCADRIGKQLSPLTSSGKSRPHRINSRSHGIFGLVDMATLLPLESAPILDFNVDEFDDLSQLLILDIVGAVGEDYKALLAQQGRVVKAASMRLEHYPLLADYCIYGFSEIGEPEWSSRQWRPWHPFRKTEFACEWRVASIASMMLQPYVVVVGDTLADFCFGSALRRMTGKASWLPSCILDSDEPYLKRTRERFLRNLRHSHRQSQEVTPIQLTSISLPPERLWEICRVPVVSLSADQGLPWSPADVGDIGLSAVCRLYHSALNNILRFEPFADRCMAGLVDTPIPMNCAEHAPSDVVWFVDVQFPGHRLPRRSCLNNLCSVDPAGSIPSVRCSAEGYSYLSHKHSSLLGERVSQLVRRPRLRCPSAVEVFQSLLGRGNMRLDLSEKGQYMTACIRRLGSLSSLATVIKDQGMWAVLSEFLKASPKGEAVHSGVLAENEATPVWWRGLRRWFLTIAGVCDIAKWEIAEARALLDDWTGRDILARGLMLHCSECRYSGWYHIEDVGVNFRCQRCREINRLVRAAWKKPESEPWWYYGLSEVVYQAMKNNGHAPVLALDRLSEKADAFLFSPEMKVTWENGDNCEVDIWAIVDGRVVIGEATTSASLGGSAGNEGKRIERLKCISDAATADDVVFATTSDAWDARTKERIANGFKGAGVRLNFLENLASSKAGTP